MVTAGGYNPPPPFPFTVERFIDEISSDRMETAAQACAAFAAIAAAQSQVATVPPSFRAAVPGVVALLTRRDGDFGAAAVKVSATAALSALLACVEGAAADAVREGVVTKLLGEAAALAREAGEGAGGVSDLDLNALDCLRILASDDTGAASLIADDEAMAFVTARCGVVVGGGGGGSGGSELGTGDPQPHQSIPTDTAAVSETALDVLCVLASKRTDGGASRTAVVRAGGVTALARGLVSSTGLEVTMRALLGLAMTTSGLPQQAELAAVPGAVPALVAASRSQDQAVAGVSKDLWGVLGRNEEVKPMLAAALRAHMEGQRRQGAVEGMDVV